MSIEIRFDGKGGKHIVLDEEYDEEYASQHDENDERDALDYVVCTRLDELDEVYDLDHDDPHDEERETWRSSPSTPACEDSTEYVTLRVPHAAYMKFAYALRDEMEGSAYIFPHDLRSCTSEALPNPKVLGVLLDRLTRAYKNLLVLHDDVRALHERTDGMLGLMREALGMED